MNNVYTFIRHGESEANQSGYIVSDIDHAIKFPLTEKGHAQIMQVTEHIKAPDIIYASPFLRTKETAQIIARRYGISYYLDSRLRERFMGDLEGKTWEEVHTYFSTDETDLQWENAPHNREPYKDVLERMQDFYTTMENLHTQQYIVVVSHGDCLTVLYRWLHGEVEERISPLAHRSRFSPFRVAEYRTKSP